MIVKAFLVATLIFLSEISLACDCPKGTTLEQDFSTSKFISYGTIKKIEQDSSKPDYESLFGEFRELEVFKGPAGSIKTIRGGTRTSGPSCTKKLDPGEYIIYSNENASLVSLCSLSQNISEYPKEKRDALLKSLRDLKKLNP